MENKINYSNGSKRKIIAFSLVLSMLLGVGTISNISKRNKLKQQIDYFESDKKLNIEGQHFVLKLAEAWENNDTNINLVQAWENKDIDSGYNSYLCVGDSYDSKEYVVVDDKEQLPKYLLLTGTPYEIIMSIPDGAVQYEFVNWDDDYKGSCHDWSTDLALCRVSEDNFFITIYYSALCVDGSIQMHDSYIVPLSKLTNEEVQEVIKQYNNNPEVIDIFEKEWLISSWEQTTPYGEDPLTTIQSGNKKVRVLGKEDKN